MNKGSKGEKYVNDLAFNSYLKYWCYPNPCDIDGNKKEICDLLIQFRDVCIIISVKNYHLNGNYDRYVRRVVAKSNKQLFGAERKLFKIDKPIFIKHPDREKEQFDKERYKNIFRITINVGEQFEYYKLFDHKNKKGFISILNRETVFNLMQELDTIPDLVGYLMERENLLDSGIEIDLNGKESDLLAIFLLNKRQFPKEYYGNHEKLILDVEGAWDRYNDNNSFVEEKRIANEVSYLIDQLVDKFILEEGWGEQLALELMNLDRTERRIVATNLTEVVYENEHNPKALVRRNIEFGNILYLFIYYSPSTKDEEIDYLISKALPIYYYKYGFKHEKIVLLASTAKLKQIKYGFLKKDGEMTEDAMNELETLCNKFGWFQNMKKTEIEYKEYPGEI